MTLSRGPWIGAACGAVLAAAGTKQNVGRALRHAVLILGCSGLIVYTGGKAYLEGVSAYGGSIEGAEEQVSAQYRALLLDEYNKIVMQSPVFGWGHVNWPKVAGMPSIDNNYLYTALGSGLVGAGLLTIMLGVGIWRVFANGYFVKDWNPVERSFRFTLGGVLVGIAISTATCYCAAQLYPLMFICLGWAEACVIAKPEPVDDEEGAVAQPAMVAGFGMMKVIA